MTSREKQDILLAAIGGALGGLAGYFVGRKTHEVVGVLTGLGIGALAFPAVVEVARR